MSPSGVSIKVCHGEAIRRHVGEMAALRIGVFRDWPYLYAGDEAYERDYLGLYVNSPTSVAVLALAGDRVVGVSTAIGLEEEPESLTAPIVAAGIDPATVLYAAESVLLPAWRWRGIGHAFFEEREAHARALGRDRVVFCRVVRDPHDPRRPAGAEPLDLYWRRRGYAPLGCAAASFSWREIGEPAETPKAMEFWGRRL